MQINQPLIHQQSPPLPQSPIYRFTACFPAFTDLVFQVYFFNIIFAEQFGILAVDKLQIQKIQWKHF